MKKWVAARRTSQFLFLTLFVYILWSTTYPLTGFLRPDIFFKINPLIMFTTALSERILLPGILFSIIMLILTLLAGRFFCGWICPLGTSFDMVSAMRKKTKRNKIKPDSIFRIVKFIILSIIGIFAVIGIQIAWILDPLVIMARFVSLNLIPTTTLLFNNIFIFIITKFSLYGWAYDLYRSLQSSFLGIKPYYFAHSLFLIFFFLTVIATALFMRRLWCRSICPLGALYACIARYALLRRIVSDCTRCKKGAYTCRMGAIHNDGSYKKSECILCMDCVYEYLPQLTRFSFPKKQTESVKLNSSRRNFLILLALSAVGFRSRKRLRKGTSKNKVIRPPGSLREESFLDRCIRCGSCKKVCITNGLQPDMFESGLTGIWTPKLVPEIGYCEYNCTLCGEVCPTGAIPKLSIEKKRTLKLGIAKVNRSTCLPWAEGKECIVCEEHCPIPSKAIKLIQEKKNGKILLKPVVDRELCIGCGICQNKCPVRPERAIKVNPAQGDRAGHHLH